MADENAQDSPGELSKDCCSMVMKCLWLGRLARPDCMKAICDLATHMANWFRNDDKRLYRLICYLDSTTNMHLIGKVHDHLDDLKLLLFVDADFAGGIDDARSTSGGWLVLGGPNTWFPICWICKRQPVTARSTTEAEVISLADSLFEHAVPHLDLWDTLCGRLVDLYILEDNQATIQVVKRGYSNKLRSTHRMFNIKVSSITDVLNRNDGQVHITYCHTEFQAADVFTKALAPQKWSNALELLGMNPECFKQGVDGKEVSYGSVGACPLIKDGSLDIDFEDAIPALAAGIKMSQDTSQAIGLSSGILVAAEVTGQVYEDYIERYSERGYNDDDYEYHTELGTILKATAAQPQENFTRPSGKLKGWGRLIEVCTTEHSSLGETAKEFKGTHVTRITEAMDFSKRSTIDAIKAEIDEYPGTSIHGSLPCTAWSAWQKMAIYLHGQRYWEKLQKRQSRSRQLIRNFIEVATYAASKGGEVSFEWPRWCTGWHEKLIIQMIHRLDMYTALVDGCAVGVVDETGIPIKKPWRFVCTSPRLAASLDALRCPHGPEFKHSECVGSRTAKTAFYPAPLCRTILASLFGYLKHCPIMACKPISAAGAAINKEMSTAGKCQHRIKDQFYGKYEVSPGLSLQSHGVCCRRVSGDSVVAVATIDDPDSCQSDSDYMADEVNSEADTDVECSPCCAMVHKLLDRKDWDFEARKAVRAEADALVKENTWILDEVYEKDDFKAWARTQNKTYHFGDLMPICSIKHAESVERRKHKGRIVFRGDSVKDQYDMAAAFQDLSASPTTIHTANSTIAYGCVPGHTVSTADAIRAYVQSTLKSKHETWVTIPKELWPDHWHREGWRRPMCRLNKALYGHPESGAHWEKHLESAIVSLGGEPVENHPSSYWFPDSKLLLTVYVDDLLLAGPAEAHDKFWDDLRYGDEPISLEDPEPLSRFLGREHTEV